MIQYLKSCCNVMGLLLLLGLMGACKGGGEQRIAPQLQGLYDQLSQSCTTAQTYEKKVWDLNIQPPATQDSTYNLQQEIQQGQACHIIRDLSYAYTSSYEKEELQEYFDTRRSGDTLIAQLKPGLEKGIQLQYQKILMDGQTFRYFESKNKQESWLYNLTTHIKISFGPDGKYLKHSLFIDNSVPLLSETFTSKIEGKSSYP